MHYLRNKSLEWFFNVIILHTPVTCVHVQCRVYTPHARYSALLLIAAYSSQYNHGLL